MIDVRCNMFEEEEQDRQDASEAARRLSDPTEVPIPYEQARRSLRDAETRSRLTIFPCDLAEANAFVKRYHRHHGPVVGHKFALAVVDDSEEVRGVAIVGRPTARMLNDGLTLEVTRLATDGCPNACSSLYAACWRAARALGYRRLVTFILDTEPGTSLSAAGWKCVGRAGGGSWDRPSRPRVDKHPTQGKFRWEVTTC